MDEAAGEGEKGSRAKPVFLPVEPAFVKYSEIDGKNKYIFQVFFDVFLKLRLPPRLQTGGQVHLLQDDLRRRVLPERCRQISPAGAERK